MDYSDSIVDGGSPIFNQALNSAMQPKSRCKLTAEKIAIAVQMFNGGQRTSDVAKALHCSAQLALVHKLRLFNYRSASSEDDQCQPRSKSDSFCCHSFTWSTLL